MERAKKFKPKISKFSVGEEVEMGQLDQRLQELRLLFVAKFNEN